MGTHPILNNLTCFESVAWGASLSDAANARGLKYRSTKEKVPVDANCGWIKGEFHVHVSIETLDEDASQYDVVHGKRDWQVLIKIDPKKPAYMTVTSAVTPFSFVVDRIHRLQRFYKNLVTDQRPTEPLIRGSRWITHHFRNPPYAYCKGASGKQQRTEKKQELTALTQEQCKKLLHVITVASDALQGEGELRMMTMNQLRAIANRFCIQIPVNVSVNADDEMRIQVEPEGTASEMVHGSGSPSSTGGTGGTPTVLRTTQTRSRKRRRRRNKQTRQEETIADGAHAEAFVIVDPAALVKRVVTFGTITFIPGVN